MPRTVQHRHTSALGYVFNYMIRISLALDSVICIAAFSSPEGEP
jgi:hypothetical protein